MQTDLLLPHNVVNVSLVVYIKFPFLPNHNALSYQFTVARISLTLINTHMNIYVLFGHMLSFLLGKNPVVEFNPGMKRHDTNWEKNVYKSFIWWRTCIQIDCLKLDQKKCVNLVSKVVIPFQFLPSVYVNSYHILINT